MNEVTEDEIRDLKYMLKARRKFNEIVIKTCLKSLLGNQDKNVELWLNSYNKAFQKIPQELMNESLEGMERVRDYLRAEVER